MSYEFANVVTELVEGIALDYLRYRRALKRAQVTGATIDRLRHQERIEADRDIMAALKATTSLDDLWVLLDQYRETVTDIKYSVRPGRALGRMDACDNAAALLSLVCADAAVAQAKARKENL